MNQGIFEKLFSCITAQPIEEPNQRKHLPNSKLSFEEKSLASTNKHKRKLFICWWPFWIPEEVWEHCLLNKWNLLLPCRLIPTIHLFSKSFYFKRTQSSVSVQPELVESGIQCRDLPVLNSVASNMCSLDKSPQMLEQNSNNSNMQGQSANSWVYLKKSMRHHYALNLASAARRNGLCFSLSKQFQGTGLP